MNTNLLFEVLKVMVIFISAVIIIWLGHSANNKLKKWLSNLWSKLLNEKKKR